MSSWTDPTGITKAGGNTILAADFNTYTRDNTQFLYQEKGCKVYRSTSNVVADNTLSGVNFDTANATEAWDTIGMHSGATNFSRLTVPTGYAGKWLVQAQFKFLTNGTNVRICQIFKNGSEIASNVASMSGLPGAFGGAIQCSVLVSAVATDYFEMKVYQNSGSSLGSGTGENGVWLAAAWVSA